MSFHKLVYIFAPSRTLVTRIGRGERLGRSNACGLVPHGKGGSSHHDPLFNPDGSPFEPVEVLGRGCMETRTRPLRWTLRRETMADALPNAPATRLEVSLEAREGREEHPERLPRPSEHVVRSALEWWENGEDVEEIERVQFVDAECLTYDDFFLNFMVKNVPVVIRGATEDWKCRKEWVDQDGRPKLSFLRREFGSGRAYVHRKDAENAQTEVEKCRFDAFLDQWESDLKDPWYWKDWHFVAEFPRYRAYECPVYFRDDWLNLYYDTLKCTSASDDTTADTSDYRFVYMGKAGTKTNLHTDVGKSYSWSANVCGQKRWLLVPPSDAHLLQDRYMKGAAPTFDEDPNLYPNIQQAQDRALEVYQGAGDIIFVPSGWYHLVVNTKDTISINHNWFNATNLHWVAHHVHLEGMQAEQAIEDCRGLASAEDFQQLVQRNVGANIGINEPMLQQIVELAHLVHSNHTTKNQPPTEAPLRWTAWHEFMQAAVHKAKNVAG